MKIGLINSGCKGLKKVTLFGSAYLALSCCRETMQFTDNLGTDTRIFIEKYVIAEILEVANNPNLNRNRGSTVRGDR